MASDYSKEALLQFLGYVLTKGLANKNTASALRMATEKLLSDLSPDEHDDVRRIDIDIATRRFHNKNPNQLSPSSLGVYQRRVEKAIREFVRYQENPAKYSGFGKEPGTAKAEAAERPRGRKTAAERDPAPTTNAPVSTTQTSGGLSIPFPLRPDFLAQIVVPRDLKANEAKRLSDFIATLVMGTTTEE